MLGDFVLTLHCNVYGCMDSEAENYCEDCLIDDESCEYTTGCMDVSAVNYSEENDDELLDSLDEDGTEDGTVDDRVEVDGLDDKEDAEKAYSDVETGAHPVVDDLVESRQGSDRNIGNDGGVFDDDEIDFDWDDFDDIMEDDMSKGDT